MQTLKKITWVFLAKHKYSAPGEQKKNNKCLHVVADQGYDAEDEHGYNVHPLESLVLMLVSNSARQVPNIHVPAGSTKHYTFSCSLVFSVGEDD